MAEPVLPADEVAEWAAMDEPGIQRWHLLAASHEKLRALVGGRSAAPIREQDEIERLRHNESAVILAGLLDGTDHATCDSCRSVMRQAHTLLVALLSRPAAAPSEPFDRFTTTIDALLERVDAWVESVEGTPAPWRLVGDMADLLRRFRVGPAPTPAPTREQVVAAIEDHIHWGNQYLDPDVHDAVLSLFGSVCAPPAEEGST